MSSVQADASDPPLQVVYPRPVAGDDRYRHGIALLQLALQKSGVAFDLRASPGVAASNQLRCLSLLEKGGSDITVAIAATSISLEQRLHPIRIPIDKGVIGWRLTMVPNDRLDTLAHVRSIADLRGFTAGQGIGWSEAAVFKANQLPAVSGLYENLFVMLGAHRFDYLSRSVREVWAELRSRDNSGIGLDTHIALHYIGATYFFVNNDNTALANALERGLERAIADGSFDRLFNQEIGQFLTDAHFEKRVILELDNPYLSPETPLNRKNLWFNPNN